MYMLSWATRSAQENNTRLLMLARRWTIIAGFGIPESVRERGVYEIGKISSKSHLRGRDKTRLGYPIRLGRQRKFREMFNQWNDILTEMIVISFNLETKYMIVLKLTCYKQVKQSKCMKRKTKSFNNNKSLHIPATNLYTL